ncbi:MAG: Na/Pi cotransporter family protein [Ruminococcaceae bacterium]|nr:Na/Pi cotransporter family protein [Oscillospiraceae bacterium]
MTFTNLLSFFAGIGLFLYGISAMGEGLEYAAGSKMKKILGALTKNKFLAVLMGTIVTALIQSSSATTVMVVGFVNAGLMTLAQAVGVIMGANIGTTVTSVLIAMDLSMIAPVALFVGVFVMLFVKKDFIKHIAQTIAGFGMLFWGLDTMSVAMEPLRDLEVFVYFMTNYSNPLVGILIGLVLTAVIQSSSASIGILQALAVQGLVPIEFAVYILLGQNIGTCVTALLSAAGSKTNSKRTAVMHLLFNVLGTVIFLLITAFTPYTTLLGKLSDNVSVQISVAHIIFNVVSTIILFPFANWIIKMACIIVPDKEPEDSKLEFKFYDTHLLSTPPVAVEQIGKEVVRMAYLARDNFNRAAIALINNDTSKREKVESVEEVINFLNHGITKNLVKINALDLDYSDAKYIGRLFHVVNDIERIGDHAVNLSEATTVRNSEKLAISEDAVAELENMRKCVVDLLDASIASFEKQELTVEEAKQIETLETVSDNLKERYQDAHLHRLNEEHCETRAGMMFVNTLIDFERVGDHAKNIAFAVGKKPGERVAVDEEMIKTY